jgi:hypothetical protein
MPTKALKLVSSTSPKPGGEPTHHFFVTSMVRWSRGYDLAALIAVMKRASYPFNVWLVPGPVNGCYSVEHYVPQVEGAQWLANYGYDTSKPYTAK